MITWLPDQSPIPVGPLVLAAFFGTFVGAVAGAIRTLADGLEALVECSEDVEER